MKRLSSQARRRRFARIVKSLLGGERIAVVKIQIGLLGLARDLQLDLEKIADKADTSSPEGLHYVLEETVLALLRNPEYCVYGFATSNSARGPEEAEDLFNEMSMVGLLGLSGDRTSPS